MQLSPPDMKLPIQFALTYPDRWDGPADRMDFTTSWSLDFEPPDLDRFPALQLGYEAARAGGTAGAVLNAANEAAVARSWTERFHFSRSFRLAVRSWIIMNSTPGRRWNN